MIKLEKDFIEKDTCGVLAEYTITRHIDSQQEATCLTGGCFTGYDDDQTGMLGDAMSRTLSKLLKPHVEKIVGEELWESQDILRCWVPGEQDRVIDNTYSYAARIILGYDFKGVDEDYKWGVHFKNDEVIEPEVGDCLIYSSDEEAYKEELLATKNSFQAEVIVYYNKKVEEVKEE